MIVELDIPRSHPDYMRRYTEARRALDPTYRNGGVNVRDEARKTYERGAQAARRRDPVTREHDNATRRRRYAADGAAQRGRSAARRAQCTTIVDPLIVLELHDGVCGICGGDVDPLDFHVDHIVQLAHGGEHSYENCQPAHERCNTAKNGRVR